MRLSIKLLMLVLTLAATPAFALTLEGVNLPDSITVGDAPLTLNGAGVRKRFFVKVYVGALYLPAQESKVDAILANPGAKSVRLHFLYKEVDAESLTSAWKDGFKNNNTEAELTALAPRIEQFNGFFRAVKSGETIFVDLLPTGETRVAINNQPRGSINGADFQEALLKIWLGDKPADADLKRGMLGVKE
jgi:hypothetical protein